MKTLRASFRLLAGAALALALGGVGCSERSSPTGPALPEPMPPGGGGAPTLLSSANHERGWTRSDCPVCHQPGRIAHHAGIAESQCDGCHGDNGTGSASALCGDCHGNPPASGAHSLHVGQTQLGVDCATCHLGAGADNSSLHRDGVVEVVIDARFGGRWAQGSCSAVTCHGEGTPSWTEGQQGCRDCHDGRGAGGPAGPASGQHASHLGRGLDCASCHAGAEPGHHNGRLDNPGAVVPDGGRYRDETPAGFSASGRSGTCGDMTVGCHGFEAPWTSGPTCGTCHPASAELPPTSGSHVRHAGAAELAYPCSTCHAAYPQGHANFKNDVVFDRGGLAGNGRYSANRCSDVYCHGGGKSPLAPASGSNPSPVWGQASTVACGTCHGAPGGALSFPSTGKHDFHVNGVSARCSDCHAAWPGQHVDGVRTIQFSPSFAAARFSRASSPNAGSCATVECHFDYPRDLRTWN